MTVHFFPVPRLLAEHTQEIRDRIDAGASHLIYCIIVQKSLANSFFAPFGLWGCLNRNALQITDDIDILFKLDGTVAL